MKLTPDRKRHLLKTISYRILGTGISFLVGYILTGDVMIGGAFSVVELCIKPLVYYGHERIWYKFIRMKK